MYIYNLGLRFLKIVKDNQEKIAIKFCDSSGITFDQLNKLSNQFANFMLQQGIKKQQVVVIQNEKTVYGFAAMIACIKIGIIYTNLDMTNPEERIKKIFAVCAPVLVIADKQISTNVRNVCHEMSVKYFECGDEKEKCMIKSYSCCLSDTVTATVSGCSPAYLMFTSGSTGTPKGVLIKHESVLNLIQWSKDTYQLTSEDIMTNLNPIYFDNSVFDFYCSVFNGLTMVAIPKEVVADSRQMIQVIEKAQCTFWFSVPSLLIYLNNLRILNRNMLKSIRIFSFGGEGYPKEQLIKLVGLYKAHAKFYNVYGPTEGTCICSAYEIKESDFEDRRGLVTLGRIAKNFEYLIMDEYQQQSDKGELCIMGSQLAIGYYNDIKKTEKSFVRNPLQEQFYQIMYRTGDLVEEKEGNLYFLGRIDNQVKHMGYRIEMEEIEAGFYSLPYIKQCAVVNQEMQSGFTKIVAYIVTDLKKEEKEMRSDLRGVLPEYMIPNVIEIVERLPQNANGKIDRNKLKNNRWLNEEM